MVTLMVLLVRREKKKKQSASGASLRNSLATDHREFEEAKSKPLRQGPTRVLRVSAAVAIAAKAVLSVLHFFFFYCPRLLHPLPS